MPKKLERGATYCWFCGHEMIWDSDFTGEDVGTGDETQVAAVLHCPNCEAEAIFTSAHEDENL